MQIYDRKEGETLTVAPIGRLDTTTAPEFEKTLDALLNGVTNLILDMEKITYVSSAGLRAILKLQKLMQKRGKMTLTGVNDDVREIFEITGFADILQIE